MVNWKPDEWDDELNDWASEKMGGGKGNSSYWESIIRQGVQNTGVVPRPPTSGGNGGLSRWQQKLQDIKDKMEREQRGGMRMGIGQPFTPKPNPLEDLYRDLLERFNQSQSQSSYAPYVPSYTGMTPEFMQGRASSITDAQYNPQIELLQNQIAQAQQRTDRNRGEVGDMYAALAAAYESDVPRIQGMYDKAQGEAQARNQQMSQNLAAIYDQQQAAVANEAAAMGQQAAAAEATAPMSQDEAFLTQLAGQIASQEQATLNQLEQNNVAYTQQGGRLAGLEGNNRQADMMAALEDYIGQQNAGIQTLENARGSDFARLMYEMQMADQQMMAQERQNANAFNAQQAQIGAQSQAQQWQQLMDIAGIRMQMAEAEMKANQEEPVDPSDLIAADRLQWDKQNAIAQMVLQLLQEGKVKNLEEAMAIVSQTYGMGG